MPKTRRQQAAEAAAAEPPAPEPPKQRKTTARKPRGKKTAEAVAAEAVSPAASAAAAAAAEKVTSPVPDDAPAAAAPNPATAALADELVADALRELPEGTDAGQVRDMLFETLVNLHGEGVGTDDLEDEQKAEVVQAVTMMLAPPAEEEAAPEEVAPEEAAPEKEAPSPATLLEEARRRQAASASAAPASPAGTEEEDSPVPAGPTPQQVMSIKVPITGPALQYTVEVKAKSPGPVPMEASQASASQAEEMSESPAAAASDPSQMSVRWYPVTNASFPEKLGERFNLIFPAHKMAPVSWADMKDAHAANNETYYAFTVAEVPPGYVLGQDYTLLTGDPKKVVAAGVVNTNKNPTTGVLTINILDMGTREDAIPKKGGVNPYLTLALKSISRTMANPNIIIRYARKQLATDNEFLSTRNTMASLGIPLSSYTRGGPEGKEALLKIRSEDKPVDISNVKLRPAEEGADRILYEYREEGTGAVNSFSGSEVDKVYVLGRRGVEISAIVEFVGTTGAVLTEGGEERDITLPDAVLRDGFKYVEPRRGGRKRTQRKRATSRRSS